MAPRSNNALHDADRQAWIDEMVHFGFRHDEDKVRDARWKRKFAWHPVQLKPAEPGSPSIWVWLKWYWRRYRGWTGEAMFRDFEYKESEDGVVYRADV